MRMRLRRDVLFTFEDLVVSFGGAITLFVGYNFLDTAMMWFHAVEVVFQALRSCVVSRMVKKQKRRPIQKVNRSRNAFA